MYGNRLAHVSWVSWKLLLAGVLAVGATSARAQTEQVDQCHDVLLAYYAQHAERPASRIKQVALPIGAAYSWHDGTGDWVVALLLPGWEIKKQPWGHGFGMTGQCVVGKTTLNVWFGKYAPPEA